MKRCIGFGKCGLLCFLPLGLLAIWAYHERTSAADVWILDDAERIVTDFVPGEEVSLSFRLRNTGYTSRRIVGAAAC